MVCVFAAILPVPTVQKWIIPGHPVYGEEQVPRLKGTCFIKLLHAKETRLSNIEKRVFCIL